MPGERKYYLWLLLAFVCCHYVSAQMPGNEKQLSVNHTDSVASVSALPPTSVNDNKFRVRNIIIIGNKRTRPDIILREIPFKPGDPYLLPDLVKKFEDARRQLMNT